LRGDLWDDIKPFRNSKSDIALSTQEISVFCNSDITNITFFLFLHCDFSKMHVNSQPQERKGVKTYKSEWLPGTHQKQKNILAIE
jgi:hypothetical protein